MSKTWFPAVYDATFRQIVTAGWNVESNGDVESSTGHFALVEIPSHPGEREDLINACDLQHSPIPQVGWYVVREDSNGLVYVSKHPTEHDARVEYMMLSKSYADWCAS